MKRKLKNRIGGFFKTKFLTSSSPQLYDVVSINKKDGTILKIGSVSSEQQAIELKQTHLQTGFTYYLLTDDSILTELPSR